MVTTNLVLDDLLAHGGWLRDLASSLMQDAAAVDDVVQETYLAAIKSPPRTGRPVRPWLHYVLRNVVRARHRGEQRRERLERLEVPAPGILTSAEIAERAEMQMVLADAVFALRAPYRDAIVLRYFEQKSQAEVAKALGILEGTVRTHLIRGRAQLREQLDRKFGDRRTWSLLLLRFAKPTAGPASATGSVLVTAALVLIGIGFFALVVPGGGEPTTQTALSLLKSESANGSEHREQADAGVRRAELQGEVDTVSRSGHRVWGRVLAEEDGSAAAGSEITVLVRTGPESGLRGVSRTDARGDFQAELRPMDPSEYAASWLKRSRFLVSHGLQVRSDRHARFFRFPLNADGTPLDLRRTGGLDLGTLVVHGGTHVSGRVRNQSGVGVPGARLFLLTDGQHSRDLPPGFLWEVGTTASDGSFSLTEPVTVRGATDSRELTLLVSSGEGHGWTHLSLPEGRAAHEVDVVVGHKSLRVRVHDELGQPLVNASVSLMPPFRVLTDSGTRSILRQLATESRHLDPWDSGVLSAFTNDFGVAQLDRAPVHGDGLVYQALVEHDDFQSRRVPVTFSGAAPQDLQVQLTRLQGLVVWGHVTDPLGAPVSQATVSVTSGAEIRTDGRGVYRAQVALDGPSSVTLEIRAAGFATHIQQVPAFKPRSSIRTDIQLGPAAPTLIRVEDIRGQPIEGLLPQLSRHPGQVLMPTELGRGRFLFAETISGEWSLGFVSRLGRLSEWARTWDPTVMGGDQDVRIVLQKVHSSRSDLTIELSDAFTGAPLDAVSVICQGRALTELNELSPGESFFGPIAREGGRLRAQVPPGDWVFQVQVEDRPLTRHHLRIDPDGASIRTILRIGRGATRPDPDRRDDRR